MKEVEEERMSNRKLRRRFGGIKSLSKTWRCRLLKCIERTIRHDEHVLPTLFLSMCVKGSMSHGRPFRKNKDSIVESLRTLIPSVPESGDHKHWVGYACNELEWEEMIKNLAIITHPCYNNHNDCPHTRSRESRNDHDRE